MDNVIEVDQLERVYETEVGIIRRRKQHVHALRGISFSVHNGEIFGLLGPNGAGKTTTIKILTTLLLPTRGRVRVMGFDPVKQHRALRSNINFILGGERNLYWRLSAYENLAYFADLYRIPRNVQSKRIPELLSRVGLEDVAHRRVETFSKGMKQRLQIARGLVNQPQVLFLDEPTIGLDPVSARQLRDILRDLNAQGTTIVLTTHYMHEADELCNRIAFVDKGQIIALDTPARLKSVIDQLSVVHCDLLGVTEADLLPLRQGADIAHVQVDEAGEVMKLRLHTKHPDKVIPLLYQSLPSGVVSGLSIQSPTLEDAYVQLVGGIAQ